jgi:hypothetical protein
MSGESRNGRGQTGEPGESDELDDDAPLDASEAEAAAATAGAEIDESLDERIGSLLEELDDVTRTREGEVERLAVGGRVFAVVGSDLLEVALDVAVARAALATPDTRPSPRGSGWVAFSPSATDRFALDRAEAWVRLAHWRAGGA